MITDIKFDAKEVTVFLNNLGKNIEKIGEPLEKSAHYMENQARANFRARGRVMSEGWRKLAKSTEKYKAKHWSGKPMMVRTGLLKNAFLTMGPRISKTGGEIMVYNPVRYAKYHQQNDKDDKNQGGKLPKRVLLRFQKTHEKEIRNIFEKWLGRIIQ